MPTVGDKVRVLPSKAGQLPREGVVTAVTASMLRIRWSTGEESSLIPGPGSVSVVGRARVGSATKASKKARPPANQASATKKVSPTAKTATKGSETKTGAKPVKSAKSAKQAANRATKRSKR